MDTLDNTEWDVVISGTGLPQSLLALSLSRSSKKVLHLDRNEYYGGDEAALSLSEAEEWAVKHSGDADDRANSAYSYATITRSNSEKGETKKLGFSRAYSLALAPHIIYARSNLLPAIVSSRTHSQLDFQAVGSWFTVSAPLVGPSSQPRLMRVPNGREDVFRDDSLDLRAKRSLMKFLRFVGSYDDETQSERWQEIKEKQISWSLKHQFGMTSDAVVAPLLALALPAVSEIGTSMSFAVPSIARHLRSIGLFGPGFSAVLPKWGGLAEIAQVACRACAVGGGVYVLSKGIKTATRVEDSSLHLELSDGEKVTTRWLVGCPGNLPSGLLPPPPPRANDETSAEPTSKGVYIVSSPLASLFPPTSEGGVTSAGAVVWVDVHGSRCPAVRILVHSSECGECPAGQCVLYVSSCRSGNMDTEVKYLLDSVGDSPAPEVLWSMRYTHSVRPEQDAGSFTNYNVITLPPLSTDIVLEDKVLDDVKQSWQKITSESEEAFVKFEAREGLGDDEAE